MNPSPTHREPLEIELLVTADQRRPRRITIADHERWRTTGRPPHEDDNDLEDFIGELRRVEADYISNKKRP